MKERLINFIKSLLSDTGEISSKRFITVNAMFLINVMVICNLCKVSIDMQIFYAILSLVVATAGLTITDTFLKK